MANKYLDSNGLLYFWQKIKNLFVTDVTYDSTSKKIQKTKAGAASDVVTLATVATSGSYNDLSNKPTIPAAVQPTTTTPKMDGTAAVGTETKYAKGDHVHPSDTSRVPTTRKVNGKALSADITLDASDIPFDSGSTSIIGSTDVESAINEVYTLCENQDSFGKVKVGSTTILADAYDDTLELVAGSNVTLTPDATNDKITIAATNTTYSDFAGATSSAAGTHGLVPAPSAGSEKTILFGDGRWRPFQLGDSSGIPIATSWVTESASPYKNTLCVGSATNSKAGLMSADDKTKLSGIAAGAEVNVNADWNASSGDAQILNKPTLGAAAAKGVVTSISADSADLPTTTAVKNYVATAITGAAAFQGTAPTSFAPTNYKKGYYWVVGTAGTYVGQTCEAGDMIFAVADYASSYKAADFTVIQTNLDITAITNAEIDTIVAA